MTELTRDQVLEALRRVQHPDARSRTSSASALISGIAVKDGNVGFAIEVDPAEAPALEPLRRPPRPRSGRCRAYLVSPPC